MSMLKVGKGSILLKITALPLRIFFILVILALALPAVYRGYGRFRAARIVMSEQSIGSYSRALEYDPANAELWWHRGQLRHYAVESVDIPGAIQDYRKALALNPRLSQAWIDLADCYERSGNYADAEAAFGRALATHAYSPLAYWQAGNFFLRRGNLERMYQCFRLAAEYDPAKLGIAIDIGWKVDPDRARILEKLVPDSLAANLSYLDFLVSHGELDLARAAWERVLKDGRLGEAEFNMASAFRYIDRLLAVDRVADAERVWDEALWKSGSGLRDTRRPGGQPGGRAPGNPNLVWNGSFEDEILGGGFDWRYQETKDVSFEIDLAERSEGLKSLMVTFTGANLSFEHLSQIIPIPNPGDYVLEVHLRTQALTTNQRPYFEIRGFPDKSGAELVTEMFPETTPWKKLSYPFAVKARCRAIRLTLRRDPSSRFNNQIKGALWLDKISIRAGSAEPAARKP